MSPPLLHIDVLLTESAIAEQFRAALAQRFLPESLFYWFPFSVRAWFALCLDEPYRNDVRSDALVRTSVQPVTRALPQGRVEMISLGAGQGTKDRHLLIGFGKNGREVTYIPVDSGQTLLEMACASAEECGVNHRGLKADITNPDHLAQLTPKPGDPPRLLLMIGNTLGAFDPPEMLRRLRGLVREGDLLLVDGELGNDAGTRAGYEHSANRAFAFAPLQSIGIQEQNGTLAFESIEDVRPGLHRIEKYFRVEADMTLRIGGEPISFQAGECIRMNHSGKFERQAFLTMLTDSRFEPIVELLSEDNRLLMVLAKPR